MPSITKRRTGELLRKMVEILIDHGDSLHVNIIFNKIQDTMQLTDFELGYYPSSPDSPRFKYLIRFSTIGMVKAGWLIKNKGFWTLTDEGRSAYYQFQNPEAFRLEVNRLYREWERNRPQEEPVEDIPEDETPHSATVIFEEVQEKSWNQIRDYIEGLSPYEFQQMVADLLEAIGYHVDWVAPRGPDGGVDIIAFTDPLGTNNPRVKVQVKHQINSSINVGDLRSFTSVLGQDTVGIYVSSGGFTRDAEAEARSQETRKVTLINLDKLFELWVAHYDRLTHEARQKLPLKPIYFLAPEE